LNSSVAYQALQPNKKGQQEINLAGLFVIQKITHLLAFDKPFTIYGKNKGRGAKDKGLR
jgi:hypothetical protein